jgi:cell division transport system ATP-binding protein
MIRLEDVGMRYGPGPEVLCDVNLRLNRGDFVFMAGPSGAGKTSLLRILGLFHMPCRGRFTMSGKDVTAMTRDELTLQRKRIGMVFQDFRLLDHLSAFDNIALPLRIHGARDDQIGGFVAEILDWLGLQAVVEAKPALLSAGQRQLVAIARAIVARPDLLLCDEPTSNVDAKLVRRLMHLFTQLSKLGTAVVIATHNDDLVERYDHPVLRIDQGRLSAPAMPVAKMAAAG